MQPRNETAKQPTHQEPFVESKLRQLHVSHGQSIYSDKPFYIYLLKKGETDILAAWLSKQDDEDLKKMSSNKHETNVLNLLVEYQAESAIKAALDRGISDIPILSTVHFEPPRTAFIQNAKRYLHVHNDEKQANTNISISKMMLEKGSDANYVAEPWRTTMRNFDKSRTSYSGPIGETALMTYVRTGCIEMVKFILEHDGDKTINVRNFHLLGLGAYCAMETESILSANTSANPAGYRFESATSLAFISNAVNSYEIMQMLFLYKVDLSIFSDSEFYKPVFLSAISEYNDSNTIAFIKPQYRKKVELLMEKMFEQNIHLDSCKEIYKVLSEMMSENGNRYRYSLSSCIIM